MHAVRLVLAPAAAFLLAACTDRNPVAAGEPPAADPQPALQRLDCSARVSDATLTCEAAAALPEGPSAAVIGQQGLHLMVTSANVRYDQASQTFGADVRVQNLLPLALGTVDGVTPDPDGIRVFFHSGPWVAVGTGDVWVSNADGEATFTAAQQPFFRYPGVLPPEQTTEAKRWTWHADPTVERFMFTVYVDARAAAPLVINEIMAHPSTAPEADGEWFELYNAGLDPVDLDGWTVASGGDAGYTIDGPLVIGRGEYLVLGGSTDALANGGAPVAHAYTDVGLGNDTGDWLALRSPAGVTVDSVDWGAAPGETASPPPTGIAMALDRPAAGNLRSRPCNPMFGEPGG